MRKALYNGYKLYLIESVEEFKYIRGTLSPKVAVGIDTETTGLDYNKDRIVGVCISCGTSYNPKDYRGFYLPIRHNGYSNNLPIEEVMSLTQELINNHTTWWWNRNYDATMLEFDGIDFPCIGKTNDAQCLAHLVKNDRMPALKDFVQDYLHFEVQHYEDNNAEGNSFANTDPTVSFVYAAADPLITVLIARKLWTDYPYTHKIYPLDNKFADVMRRIMYKADLYFDRDIIKKLYDENAKELASVRNKIFAMTGYTFKLNSNRDKAEALCFSEDTEFLTEKGFMKYDEITTEKIAQFNEASKEVEFVVPEGRISRFSKEMYHINHRYTDLLVTPGHKMYVALDKDNYKLMSIDDIADRKRGFRVKNTVNIVGVERTDPFVFESREGDTRHKKLVIPADAFIEFLGFWYGDGYSTISQYKKKDGSIHTSYKVGLTQSTCKEKENTVNWLVDLNHRMGNVFGISKRVERYDFQCSFKVFAEYMENNCKVHMVKTIPLWIRDLSARQRRLFLDGYFRADGTFNGVHVFLSSNLEMLKELRYLSVISGRKCSNIRVKAKEGSIKSIKGVGLKHESKPMYEFSTTIKFDYSHITSNNIEFITDYNSRVVCFQVPTSVLVVRRKGKVSVCGNCRFVTLTVKTAKGEFKVDKEVLASIDHPLAQLLLKYAKLEKYRSSYLAKMLVLQNPFKINYQHCNAETGRLSSGSSKGNPYFAPLNVQNFPKVEMFKYLHRDNSSIGYRVDLNPFQAIGGVIDTPDGAKAVSDLKEGDLVLTSKGEKKVISITISDIKCHKYDSATCEPCSYVNGKLTEYAEPTEQGYYVDLGEDVYSVKSQGNDVQIKSLLKMKCKGGLRDAFICPPGYVWISQDYSAEEVVLLANLSGEPNLLNPLKEGKDIHKYVATQMFGHYDPTHRTIAKTITFCSNYGGSGDTIARRLGVPKEQGEMYLERYNKTMSKAYAWKQNMIKQGRHKGFVFTFFGRPRAVYQFFSSSKPGMKGYAERTCMNSPIQGGGGDVIRIDHIRYWSLVDPKSPNYNKEFAENTMYINTIHDEINLYAKEGYARKASDILYKAMYQNYKQWQVPLTTSPSVGTSWGTQIEIKGWTSDDKPIPDCEEDLSLLS